MDTQRLILLLVFFFSCMMLWESWQRHGQPQPGVVAPVATQAATGSAAGAGNAAVPSAPTFATSPTAVPNISAAAQSAAPLLKVSTDLVNAEISAQGGDLVRLELLHHRATEKKDANFVLLDPVHLYAAQSGLIGTGLPNHKTLWKLPTDTLALKEGENELHFSLEAAIEGGGKVLKTYIFKRGSYLVEVEHAIVDAATPAGAHAYFQLTRDDKPPEGANAMMMTFTGGAIYTDLDKFKKVDFGDFGSKNKHPAQADNGWVSLVQHYFVSAWLPANGDREFFTRKLDGGLYSVGVVVPFSGKLTVPLYAGPQEQDKLDKLAPGLALVVDYGWLTPVAAPLFWVLEWIHGYVGNWGWAIILLTVLIKAVFFPLSAASYKSMAKMRVLTPKLMKLKETYADDRARMNQEMMEMYKREKVNPLGGCLPILVQIPVFIALYWVLLGTVEMRGAPWLGWIKDLSQMDPYYVLPLIMGVTMFVQTKLNPTPPDPIQAKIMLWMPVAFTVMFLWFPSGLVLYWVVNNTLSIAQQWQCNRMIEGASSKH
ncbi:MAG: membrane protein insertase YidC [Rhodocyclaceae bacterium]|nr:membrane protein insertase YidC [Rhodocyclaceae bacterium]MDZ4216251.1 membrane protein insertase YidC [Rhodocyclaceae bacterium]